MRRRPGRALCLALAAIMGMTAVTAHAKTLQVTISDLKFSSEEIEARVGDTVEWINRDALDHTATAPGRWDVTIPANGSGRLVVKKAGQAAYYCRFHPNMTARIAIAQGSRK